MAEIAHDSEVWPELIDLERLTRWMDDQELGADCAGVRLREPRLARSADAGEDDEATTLEA